MFNVVLVEMVVVIDDFVNVIMVDALDVVLWS